jgi:predicted transcriptional regulator
MDTVQPPGDSTQAARRETEAERQTRLVREAEMIAEADAEIEAGFYVDSDEVDAWIDSIGTDHELPPPPTRRR